MDNDIKLARKLAIYYYIMVSSIHKKPYTLQLNFDVLGTHNKSNKPNYYCSVEGHV